MCLFRLSILQGLLRLPILAPVVKISNTKLTFMATNLTILEVIEEDDRKVDFDMRKGGQYMNLIHLLPGRQKGKVVKKLTAVVAENVGDEKLKKVSGESQSQLVKEHDVGFKFNMVKQELAELTCESLRCDGDESLVVNFAFRLYQMLDENVSIEKRSEMRACQVIRFCLV